MLSPVRSARHVALALSAAMALALAGCSDTSASGAASGPAVLDPATAARAIVSAPSWKPYNTQQESVHLDVVSCADDGGLAVQAGFKTATMVPSRGCEIRETATYHTLGVLPDTVRGAWRQGTVRQGDVPDVIMITEKHVFDGIVGVPRADGADVVEVVYAHHWRGTAMGYGPVSDYPPAEETVHLKRSGSGWRVFETDLEHDQELRRLGGTRRFWSSNGRGNALWG